MGVFLDDNEAFDFCDDKACAPSSNSECARLLRVPHKVIEKCCDVINVATADSRISNCITKSYGKYVKGTGALLATQNTHLLDRVERIQEICCSDSRSNQADENRSYNLQTGMRIGCFKIVYWNMTCCLYEPQQSNEPVQKRKALGWYCLAVVVDK